MYSYKKKAPSSTANDICLVILTVVFIVSIFFFVVFLSHASLGTEEQERRIPVVNNLAKWTVRSCNIFHQFTYLYQLNARCFIVLILGYRT